MSVINKTSASINLSIIITVHAEGILLHKTLASVRRATAHLDAANITWEVLIHADNPKPNTLAYFEAHQEQLAEYRMFTNQFGDLGSSRNFSVKQAKGDFATFIDADDLMSERWLIDAYNFLQTKPIGEYIAHSESTVEFGSADSVVVKHGEINQATDTLLTVFSNRWNSIIMAPRELLLSEPYSANAPGYGYEDWHLNCRFIARGLHNVLIPETVIFVRRKADNSEWLRQKMNRLVLPANPLFTFSNIRKLSVAGAGAADSTENTEDISAIVQAPTAVQQLKQKAAPILRRVPLAERVARKAYRTLRPVPEPVISVQTDSSGRLPEWLITEWRAIHSIEKLLFPSTELIKTVPIYDSLTPEHYQTGEAFKKLVDHTTKDTYDYILFVPWLKTGGADLVCIRHANALKAARPDKNVLVIATLGDDSPWADQLADGVDFIPFGQITSGLSVELQYRLLEQLIENSHAQYLHIVNAALAYDFATSHEAYITATNKKLIATSFSQSVDGTGRIFGYSHTHVPLVYEMATLITTDNQAVVDMWQSEYGFDPARLRVQHTPQEVPELHIPERPLQKGKLRVLWTARISPEKQPELLAKIAREVKDLPISIDMYGPLDEPYGQAYVRSLPSNVTYHGMHKGFFTLPLETYDVLLYTSLFDGMPLTILEAAGARLPIISSQVGGIPAFIGDDQAGILVHDIEKTDEYVSALKQLLEHPELLKKYSDEAYKRLDERHSEKAYQKQLQAFMNKIGY